MRRFSRPSRNDRLLRSERNGTTGSLRMTMESRAAGTNASGNEPTRAALTVQLMIESELAAEALFHGLNAAGFVPRRSAEAWNHQAARPAPDIALFDLPRFDVSRLQDISVLRGLLGNPPSLCIVSSYERDLLAAAIRIGIDDFVFEPYGVREVVQRIELLMCRRRHVLGAADYPFVERRRSPAGNAPAAGGSRGQSPPRFQVRESSKSLAIGGEEIRLTPREFKIMVLLGREPGRIFSTNEIIKAAWPASARATSADVHQYMHMLRRKIEQRTEESVGIMNVRGFGYALTLGATANAF